MVIDILANIMTTGADPGGRTPKIGKNMIFWRKIVIFHTTYHKNFRASLCSAQFFSSAPPLTRNPGSAPGLPMRSVPIISNVVSSNPTQARCTGYNIL